jgi:DNA-binding GntR family transcriptional regulator
VPDRRPGVNSRGITPTRRFFTTQLVNSAADGEQPQVIDDLRRAILSGDEPPGTLIPIDAVARFFGVSQIPVREALKVLLGEGLVEHVPHVGHSVAKLSFSEFRELYDVRQALEAAALRAACRHASTADDGAVRRTHSAMAEAMTNHDERGYHAESRRFHSALIAPSQMPRLVHMYESAWNMTEPARPMSRVPELGRETFYDDHDRMLAAFVARDEETLLAESKAHFEHLKAAIEFFSSDLDVFRCEP